MPRVRSIAIPSRGWAAWPLPFPIWWRMYWCVRKKAARSPSNSRSSGDCFRVPRWHSGSDCWTTCSTCGPGSSSWGKSRRPALACVGGVRILSIGGAPTDAWWNVPLTILWLLACMNAFNLVDGLDGLAAGVGLFATLTVFTAAMMQHNMVLAVATFPLAGALLAFLCYNFNPATIFLGDSGSLLIGFLLGCYAAIWSNKSATLLGMTAPLMALSIPLLDVALAIVRRFLRRQPIFTADRGHIHHRLLDRGFTPRRVVLVLYGLCGLAAAFSLLQGVVHSFSGALLLLFGVFVLLGIQYLGYAEFDLAGRLLFGGDFQRSVSAQLDLRKFRAALVAAGTPAGCWEVIREACGSLDSSRCGCAWPAKSSNTPPMSPGARLDGARAARERRLCGAGGPSHPRCCHGSRAVCRLAAGDIGRKIP
jgi:hypothetical protein